MRLSKKLIIAVIFPLAMGINSCKNYLDEELVSTLTYQYYDTEQGLEDLVKAAYEPTRSKFEYEHAYAVFNFGTDEFTHGDQTNLIYYNTYESRLNSQDDNINGVWTANYDGINRCNIGIERIPTIQGIKTLLTAEQKTQRIAELRFLRGFYYFNLVQQFGAVPLVLESSIGVRLDFPRVAVPEIYNLIMADLRFAADNLAAKSPDFGRATKGAAQHFLAKAYLTRGSAVNEDRGKQSTDIDSAAYYSTEVINSGNYALEANYAKLWDVSSYAASQAAQISKEIVFSAQFNNSILLAGRFGNQTHMYYGISYDTEDGMVRDLPNGRPFRRLMPTNYTLDIFDKKNDSRFYKSMQTAWISNNAAKIPKWPAGHPLANKPKYAVGDTAFLIVVNTPQTTLTEDQIANTRYKVFARYYKSKTNKLLSHYDPTLPGIDFRKRYPALIKFMDPFRLTPNEQKGTRDGILARLGETYLIAAEAYGRKGDYSNAVFYINELRKRASYKSGEAKAPQYWLSEGGVKNDVSSTFDFIKIPDASYFDANDPREMYPHSANSRESRFIHFILNERSRELLGELYRWEDLARTETLIERAKQFNVDAAGIQPHHKLRPIPQAHLERVFNDGKPLSAEERQAQQNAGY